MVENNYLKVKYSFNLKPKSNYPKKFCKNIIKRFSLSQQTFFLEIGSGRGDFTNTFYEYGIKNIYAIDYDKKSKEYLYNDIAFEKVDINNQKIPFDNETFDVIYSKSVIEHLQSPENYFRECYRVLKKGGKIITFTPNWETQYKNFFDDITHIKPFTMVSLRESHLLFGFDNCIVEEFFQLPLIWKFPIIKYLAKILGIFVPIRSKFKLLRWSKETMILSIAEKKI